MYIDALSVISDFKNAITAELEKTFGEKSSTSLTRDKTDMLFTAATIAKHPAFKSQIEVARRSIVSLDYDLRERLDKDWRSARHP